MKTCTKCHQTKSLIEFSKYFRGKNGLKPYCKQCANIETAKWQKDNKERKKATDLLWKESNKERSVKYFSDYYNKNISKLKSESLQWKKNNPGKASAIVANYRATKLQATPKWLTKEQKLEIKAFYIKARELEKLNGIKMNVDHIIPLQGENVCGLHVPWNLQILTKKANTQKSNKLLKNLPQV